MSPDRIYRNKLVIWLIVGLLACCAGLGAAGLIATGNLSRTLDAQKQSSARGECRAAIVNEADDLFRHRIGAALNAVDPAERRRIYARIDKAERTQAIIDRECPAPLVSTTTTTRGGTLPEPR